MLSLSVYRFPSGVSLTAFAVAAAAHAQVCGPIFPDQTYDAGIEQSVDIAFADMDGDGIEDMIAADFDGVRVRLGIGDGSFGPGVWYDMGGNLTALAVGDLDNDGDVDVVAVGWDIDSCDPYYDPGCCDPYYDPYCYNARGGSVTYINNDVRFRRNNGDGTLGGRTNLPMDADPQDVVVGDFNNDGFGDIAAIEFDNFLALHVFTSSAGSFSSADQYSVSFGGAGMEAGDINGDGVDDLVIVRSFNHVLDAVISDGAGVFLPPVSYNLLSVRPGGVDLGDVDGDGDLDAAVTVDSGSRFELYANDGSGVFARTQVLSTGNDPTAIQFMDTDDDNDLDIVVASGSTRTFRVHENDGSGTFGPDEFYSVGGVNRFAVADVNGDGLDDLGMSNGTFASGFVIRLNTADGIGAQRDDYVPVSDPTRLAYFDFDNDGDTDIAVGRISSQNPNLAVMVNAGDGTFPTQIDLFTETTPNPATGDVNGDGFSDIVTTNLSGNSMSVFLNNQAGGFDAPVTIEIGGILREPILADLDGDSDLDYLTISSSAELVTMLFNDGSGTFGGRFDFTVAGISQYAEAEDVDGDGDLDLVTTFTGTDEIGVLFNNGSAVFSGLIKFAVDDFPQDLDLGDLDGDGDLDAAVRTARISAPDQRGGVSLLFNDGSGSFGGRIDLIAGFGADHVRIGDVDDDGDQDIVASNRGSATFSVFDNTDGSGAAWSDAREYQARRGPRWADVIDINEDGHADIITAIANDGVTVHFGVGCGDLPCPADLAAPFGSLNFFDIAAYIGLYNAGDPGADLAAPFGSLNFFDIVEYIAQFNAGCP